MAVKVFRYEMRSFLRTMIPIYCIVLCSGILNRLIQMGEEGGRVYNVVFTSSMVGWVAAMAVCLVVAVVLVVVRYYKGLFSNEGYLNCTLPVTPRQQIGARLCSAYAVLLLSLAVCLLSMTIAAWGDLLQEIRNAIGYLMDEWKRECGSFFPLMIAEIAVLVLTTIGHSVSRFYTCISIGQRAKKNRILAAFGCYFLIWFIRQIAGTVLIVVSVVLDEIGSELPERVIALLEGNGSTPQLFVTLVGGWIVFELILICVYLLISHNALSRHLNLE